MTNSEPANPIWKLLGGVLFGVVLTWAYVRFGYTLPGIVQIGATVTSEAAIATAESRFYDPTADIAARRRALAVIVANKPDLFIEIDAGIGDRVFDELLRRKAVRKAKLLRHRDRAYDITLQKPALRKMFENRHGVTETAQLKRKMFIADIARDEILTEYLNRRFPRTSGDQRAEIVIGVYQNDLKRSAADRTAAESAQIR